MSELEELRAENERLRKLNNNLARQVVGMGDTLEAGRRDLLAAGWEACAKLPSRPSLYDNPYQKPVLDFSGGIIVCKTRDTADD